MKTLPLDCHEETTDDPVAKPALKAAREAVDAILATANELGIDSPHLAQAALPKVERTLASLDNTLQKIERNEDALRKQADAKFAIDKADPAVNHIVAYWQGQKNPITKMISAVNGGDRRTVAVLLNMPAYVLGISNEEQATLRETALVKLEPEITAQMQAVAKAKAKVERAGGWVGTEMANLLRPSAAKFTARQNATKRLK